MIDCDPVEPRPQIRFHLEYCAAPIGYDRLADLDPGKATMDAKEIGRFHRSPVSTPTQILEGCSP